MYLSVLQRGGNNPVSVFSQISICTVRFKRGENNLVDYNSLLPHLLKRISRLLSREGRSNIVSAVE